MFSYTGNVHASFFCSLKFLLFFEMIGIEATNCSLKFQWLQIKGASCVTIATGLFYLFIVGIYQRLIKLSLNLTTLLFYSRTGTCFIYNCTSTKYSLVNCDLQFQYKMSNVFLCHKRIVIDCTLSFVLNIFLGFCLYCFKNLFEKCYSVPQESNLHLHKLQITSTAIK